MALVLWLRWRETASGVPCKAASTFSLKTCVSFASLTCFPALTKAWRSFFFRDNGLCGIFFSAPLLLRLFLFLVGIFSSVSAAVVLAVSFPLVWTDPDGKFEGVSAGCLTSSV